MSETWSDIHTCTEATLPFPSPVPAPPTPAQCAIGPTTPCTEAGSVWNEETCSPHEAAARKTRMPTMDSQPAGPPPGDWPRLCEGPTRPPFASASCRSWPRPMIHVHLLLMQPHKLTDPARRRYHCRGGLELLYMHGEGAFLIRSIYRVHQRRKTGSMVHP